MKSIRSQSWLCLALGLIASIWLSPAAAQLAPTGGHYAGRGSDTGYEPGMVNASGGYAASVPLDLPAARGGLPVPLQIVSGGRGVGAAGLGWDVPLSFVRRDTSFARRRPMDGGQTGPQPRARVSLTLQGRALDLIPSGQDWAARVDAPDLKLREQNGGWVLFDGHGLTYFFTAPSALAGTDLWLLTSVSGPAGSIVQLAYDIATPALSGGSGISVDLASVVYNSHPQTGCAKHELVLTYNPAATDPLSLMVLGGHVLARMRTLNTVDVMSRADCDSAAERLRRYELSYLPDADTQQPRLRSVQMLGRQGTTEANTAVPVASYGYGRATHASTVRYQKTQSIHLPADADSAKISSTAADGSVVTPTAAVSYATWQSLTDVTGDGRPDLVFPKAGKLWVARNRPGANGTTVFDAPSVALSDTTFTSGPFETRAATHNRFTVNANTVNVDKVWRKAIDFNGDGRMDIIDAGEVAGQWVVYLNLPDAAPSGVKWKRLSLPIHKLYHYLSDRGLDVHSDYVPLASRFTGRGRTEGACWKFNGSTWDPYPQGFATGDCGHDFAQGLHSVGPEQTFTEWDLLDLNGDGYPELVFNSSPVKIASQAPQASGTPGQVLNTLQNFKIQPSQGSSNNVDAVFNVRGMLLDESGTDPFSTPVTVKAASECGVGEWAETSGTQEVICAIGDVNGDGLPDRIEGRSMVFLGTGRGFSNVTLTLPDTFARQKSPQMHVCVDPEPDAPGSTPFGVWQMAGLRDLTGDGIPDYVSFTGSKWQVAVGTGVGFAPLIDIDVVGAAFTLSGQTERCDGKSSSTRAGLYDIDGDGKPEVVILRGQNIDVYQLAGGTVPRTPEAGRLVQVDNGYGARTIIGYRSAKEDGITSHQVPFPENVVASVVTSGLQGLGGNLSAVSYAYGGAELFYDTFHDAFTLPGYSRSVELRVVSVQQGKANGRATLTDTYGLAPFVPTMTKNERFRRYRRAGHVRDVTVLSGSVSTDPWAMLATHITTDTRRIASTHYDWAVRHFEGPDADTNPLDCMELMYPYDYVGSLEANWGPDKFLDVCAAHGFLYEQASDTWRGTAAPPSTSNVATRSEVREIDDYGRVINVLHQKDVHRDDDDLCIETKYAAPTGQNERMLFAPSSRRLWDCTKTNDATYSAEYWEYDNLPLGNVSAGRPTSRSVERRDTSTASLLNTVRVFDATYDAAGNPVTVTKQREDGAIRTVTLAYEPFGLAAVHASVEATGSSPVETTVTRDPVSLYALSTTDANHTQWGAEFDGFGRQVRSTMTPPGGPLGVRSTQSYLGFSGSDPLGRRIVSKGFTDAVAPPNVATAKGRTSTVYLDELGRERRTELALGADYANQTLIAGARIYDSLGRVSFEADPFPSSQNPATAYGTTHLFQIDGTPSCVIRGKGPQPLISMTDEINERYPTCYTRSFLGYQETLGVSDAAALLPSSPQAGVTKLATVTAVGRLLSRSTWQNGTRLEHATFSHDRLGQLTGMTRYQDPVGAANPVLTSWRFDSLGQVLQWQDQESAIQFTEYSNWGEPTEVRWTDGALDHRIVTKYDSLGRISHREERKNGATDTDTVNDYLYDVGISVVPQVTPTYVMGRLAQAKAPTGDVFFSYDALGRVNARTFTGSQNGKYVEKTMLHDDGTLAALELYLPDTGFARERVDYSYDSAARLHSMTFAEGPSQKVLYEALSVDPFGRVRKARYGAVADYTGSYADVGRRLMKNVQVKSTLGSRRILYLGYDPLGRELSRREIKDSAASGPKTDIAYDALGRLGNAVQTDGATTLSNRQFTYDALGNVLGLADVIGTSDATLSYRNGNRDRICRIGYGNGGLGGTTCNVVHDAVGNIIQQATRTGTRELDYFASGNVRGIDEQATQARFRYDAFGALQELDVEGSATDSRHDRRYGQLVEVREEVVGTARKAFISRQIPGPGGVLASRRGAGKEWIFHFGEQRGNRFFTDENGAFVQDVGYQPFGEPRSTGVQPGSIQYTESQWNGGDALAAFGISQLGARIYDPVIGRFVSRDPLLVPRTSTTTNPYAFAMNDPLNLSDPSGMDPCMGGECQGPGGGGFPGGGGGPSGINPPGLYFPSSAVGSSANPQSTYRPPTPTTFSGGPQSGEGKAYKFIVESVSGVTMGDAFDFDALARAKVPLSEVLDRIAETSEAVDEYNATIDRWSSFSAGFGDSVWFWSPGCAASARQARGITSGDADRWSYMWGSITGIFGSIVAPHPTSVIAAPKANVAAEVEASIKNVNPTRSGSNCGNCALATDATLAGRPASALPGGMTPASAIEKVFGRTFSQTTGVRNMSSIVRGWGPGSRGIVFGARGQPAGHFFNVVNVDGMILYVDGQKGGAASLKGFTDFYILRTD